VFSQETHRALQDEVNEPFIEARRDDSEPPSPAVDLYRTLSYPCHFGLPRYELILVQKREDFGAFLYDRTISREAK